MGYWPLVTIENQPVSQGDRRAGRSSGLPLLEVGKQVVGIANDHDAPLFGRAATDDLVVEIAGVVVSFVVTVFIVLSMTHTHNLAIQTDKTLGDYRRTVPS
jgi:hypothetical protein